MIDEKNIQWFKPNTVQPTITVKANLSNNSVRMSFNTQLKKLITKEFIMAGIDMKKKIIIIKPVDEDNGESTYPFKTTERTTTFSITLKDIADTFIEAGMTGKHIMVQRGEYYLTSRIEKEDDKED